MTGAEKLMKEILKEYEAPNKIRKRPYSYDRFKRGRKIILKSE